MSRTDSALATIYTIGHSTRTLDQLVAALQAHGVSTLVDIRSFPMSRRLPHFNRESLEVALPKHSIAYVWMKELGGRRKKIRKDSPNTGLRNDSFRNYADYMLTPEFARAIERLLEWVAKSADPLGQLPGKPSTPAANGGPSSLTTTVEKKGPHPGVTPVESRAGNTAIMCAERVYFQCHRMLVSDYLTVHGHTVLHIDDEKRPPRPHKLLAEARLFDGKLIYNAQQLF